MRNSNNDWITTKQLAELKGVSERAVRKAISKNKYVIRKCSKSYEILVTSLEESVKLTRTIINLFVKNYLMLLEKLGWELFMSGIKNSKSIMVIGNV